MSIANGDLGSRLLLILTGYGQVEATVLKAFTPFTKSEVYLVEIDAIPSTRVILKVYDPRALNDRMANKKRPYLWTMAAEHAAAAVRERVRLGQCPELEFEDWLWGNYSGNPEALARSAVAWEEQYYRMSMECFKYELAAYDLLKDRQGLTVCQLYASGRLLPKEDRAVELPVIVIEYIDGCTLRDLHHPERIPAELCRPLIQDVDSFAGRGIIHDDLNNGNIMFTPVDQPTRVVVVDFGSAAIRDPPEIITEGAMPWDEHVRFCGDGRRIRQVLAEKGIPVD